MKVIEIDKDKKVVISASTEAKVIEVSPEKKVVRLANGNTLMSSGDGYGSPRGFFVIEVVIAEARGGVIREVPPDKKTVRIIKSPAMKHPATFAVVDQ